MMDREPTGVNGPAGTLGRSYEGAKDVIVQVHKVTVEMTAAKRWSEARGRENRGEEWPSQRGSVADLWRPELPTSVIEHSWQDN